MEGAFAGQRAFELERFREQAAANPFAAIGNCQIPSSTKWYSASSFIGNL
jgi:hypothetical protein